MNTEYKLNTLMQNFRTHRKEEEEDDDDDDDDDDDVEVN
jgi:hypothetical protein